MSITGRLEECYSLGNCPVTGWAGPGSTPRFAVLMATILICPIYYSGLQALNNYRVSSCYTVRSYAGYTDIVHLNPIYDWYYPCYGLLMFFLKTLNLTGFRKVLKKYAKITKTSVLDAYMKEKVRTHLVNDATTHQRCVIDRAFVLCLWCSG